MEQTTQGLRRLRGNQAGLLTRHLNKSIRGIQEGRSKRFLRECVENIEHAIVTLKETNNIYCLQLDSEEEYREAQDYFNQRRETAQVVILDIEAQLDRAGVPSITDMSTQKSISATSNSSRQKMRLEAEKAELELHQAKQKAQLLQKEADLKMEKTQFQAKNMVETAAFKAKMRWEMVEGSVKSEAPPERPVITPPQVEMLTRVEQWLGGLMTDVKESNPVESQSQPYVEPQRSQLYVEPQRSRVIQRHEPYNHTKFSTPERVAEIVRQSTLDPVVAEFCPLQTQAASEDPTDNGIQELKMDRVWQEPLRTQVPLHHQPESRAAPQSKKPYDIGIPDPDVRRNQSMTPMPPPGEQYHHQGEVTVQPCRQPARTQERQPTFTQDDRKQSMYNQLQQPDNPQPQQREQSSHNQPQNTQPRQKVHSIDGWIDQLIPELETELFDEMSCIGGQDRLLAYLVRTESEKGLPSIELPAFNGSAKEWPRFIERFYVQVHCKLGLTDTRRMDVLQSHLTGDAQKLVQGIGFTGKCYAEALKELKRTFGHHSRVVRAYLEAVTNGDVLAPYNTNALREFFVNVRDAIYTLTKLDRTMDLQGTEIVQRAAKRIPRDKVTSWNRFVGKISSTREPKIYDLRDWLQDALITDTNPYAIPYNRREDKPRTKLPETSPRPKQSTVWNAVAKDDGQVAHRFQNRTPANESRDRVGVVHEDERAGGEMRNKRRCGLCHGEFHPIHRCEEFKAMTLKSRKEVVKQQQLCFNCLQKHRVRDCPSSGRCKQNSCGRKHHTLLHEEREADRKVVYNSHVDARSSPNTFFQLVDVYVMGNNGSVVPTVAVLDSGSQITLIHESLAKDLGLKGEKRPLVVKTMNSEDTRQSSMVSLRMKSKDPNLPGVVHIQKAWTVEADTFRCPVQHLCKDWNHCKNLGIPDYIDSSEVKMLIGMDYPEVHLQLEVRRGKELQPLAIRTKLGWSIMGVGMRSETENDAIEARVNFIKAEDQTLQEQIKKFWETESFGTTHNSQCSSSMEDRESLKRLENGTQLVNGHYQVPMLWRKETSCINLPDSQPVALQRYRTLLKRFRRDNEFKELYCQTMNSYIDKGWARRLTEEEAIRRTPKTWYLPHFGVTNPHKPGKVRIVFDAAATTEGTCLNDNLMTGPDLLNNLFGILQRFRLYEITFSADVEAMFHMVTVDAEDADCLRFMWKRDPEAVGPPYTYRMQVHIFGAVDSPACASYALKLATGAMSRDFYMDDLHKSLESTETAIKYAADVVELARKGGFRLHKCVSNSREVLETIGTSEKAVQEVEFDKAEAPIQRTLGVKWNVREDFFLFVCHPKERVMTKRGVVSLVSSIYDPCGFISPFTVRAKFFIQEVWSHGLDWDEPLPIELEQKWNRWLAELEHLTSFKLPRHHVHFSTHVKDVEIHIFCDASEKGFGAIGYLRYDIGDRIIVSFLAAKTHVAPLKVISMPRLELQGAVLGMRLGRLLEEELQLGPIAKTYWSDSMVVLQYLRNETRRFKPFVANRVTEILENSKATEWYYVPTESNPADYCTRGVRATALQPSHIWFQGPAFLRERKPFEEISLPELPSGDPELKPEKIAVMNTTTEDNSKRKSTRDKLQVDFSAVFDPTDFSTWRRLIRQTAWISRAVHNFASKKLNQEPVVEESLTVQEHEAATQFWVRRAQQDEYVKELEALRKQEPLDARSKLLPLSPVYDAESQIIRVGGRLRKAIIPDEAKHQQILPRDHVITQLLATDAHWRIMHRGQEHLIAELRQRYWPVGVKRVARRAKTNCVLCRFLYAMPKTPKMADLPLCRVDVSKGPFSYCGVDYFGPMSVKIRRNTAIKRWGCLFTCLNTRAVHIELAESLETDDFLLCLRNFIARRGQPRKMHSDNGTNFKGANEELKQCLRKLDQSKIRGYLAPQGIEWHFNPPLAPHMGGAWERLVGSVKRALNATVGKMQVTESVLRTALIETEGVLNSRPLTHNSPDPEDFSPLTPNHFLLGRAEHNIPPDRFEDKEIDSRRRWRQSQVVADRINKRWLREYLPNLTLRQQWMRDVKSVGIGDLVLIVDEDAPRKHWEMARITDTFQGDDGRIRAVKVKTARTVLTRPVSKLAVLEENVKD